MPPADWPGKRRLHHTPRGEKMQTTVPAGKKGGEVIQVHTASGWVVEVVIPVGLSAGQSFQFHLPLGNQTDPPTPPTPTPHMKTSAIKRMRKTNATKTQKRKIMSRRQARGKPLRRWARKIKMLARGQRQKAR